MRRTLSRRGWLVIGGTGIVAAITLAACIERQWVLEQLQAYLIGRAVLAVHELHVGLPEPDVVEVSVLAGRAGAHQTEVFQVPGGPSYSVAKVVRAGSPKAHEVVDALERLRTDIEHESLCIRKPGFGIRVWRHSRLVFETSVCFECGNLSIPIPPFGSYIYGFEARDPSARRLRAALEALAAGKGTGA